MILPDANTLLYAVNTAAPGHRSALQALEEGFLAPRGVGFAWSALLAFVRLSTRAGIFPRALSVENALHVVTHWLDHPNAQVLHPGDRHAEVLGRLLRAAGTAGNLTSDAHLAALAVEHNARIVSFDRDFARFPDVSWTHPG
ncbi:MAG: PIN domain-containing protein [Gammaproteobacteria bacterium]|nr:PIN domain-containing protein [Gammaproteobacteria bacterium]